MRGSNGINPLNLLMMDNKNCLLLLYSQNKKDRVSIYRIRITLSSPNTVKNIKLFYLYYFIVQIPGRNPNLYFISRFFP